MQTADKYKRTKNIPVEDVDFVRPINVRLYLRRVVEVAAAAAVAGELKQFAELSMLSPLSLSYRMVLHLVSARISTFPVDVPIAADAAVVDDAVAADDVAEAAAAAAAECYCHQRDGLMVDADAVVPEVPTIVQSNDDVEFDAVPNYPLAVAVPTGWFRANVPVCKRPLTLARPADI